MTARPAAALALVLLLGGLIALVIGTTPWSVQPKPPGGPTPASVRPYFSAAEQVREDEFHRAARPPGYLGLAAGTGLALLLGLSPLGARLVAAVGRPVGGGWGWQVVLGSVALAGLGQLAVVPFDIWGERVLRRYGLSTQDWTGWFGDLGKSLGIGVAIGAVALLGFYGLVRAGPRTWWAWTALASAGLVVLLSYVWPLVVAPAFNRFTPMPAGPLRSSLVAMADRDGVPVHGVLVADASRRTTALNAYVSGFGATRRIVVYDTLLDTANPAEVRVVVAHELGHAKRGDVLHATLLGALGVAAGCCAAYLLLTSPPLLRRAGVPSPADTRSLALLSALIAVGTLVAMPAQNLVSRRIEARADVHALNLTGDPRTFITMEKRLSVTNLSDLDPNPVIYALFFDHPTAPQRIALARDWARLHR